mmetsp:Transcript_41468/g.36847  ORF Transcript_41468/g.36847 Transcript_41468/m.36847 type:complete len:86 (-) Transcript_41468:5726-5983(-)
MEGKKIHNSNIIPQFSPNQLKAIILFKIKILEGALMAKKLPALPQKKFIRAIPSNNLPNIQDTNNIRVAVNKLVPLNLLRTIIIL